jgi:phosphoribosylaminoimidazolecarboxamide formyltransferase/IMP cyclohydrolase
MIDIGGPCMLRAAAKNHRHVIATMNPKLYENTLETLRGSSFESFDHLRERMGGLAFCATQTYDCAVFAYLFDHLYGEAPPDPEEFPPMRWLNLNKLFLFRYGENPHQSAACYHMRGTRKYFQLADETGEKGISFNNATDADSAAALCADLTRSLKFEPSISAQLPCVCVFVKHTNACGAAIHGDPVEAYKLAYLGDPNAAMGGILAVSFEVNAEFAEMVMDTYDRLGRSAGAGGFFAEVWIAPSFDNDAVRIIRARKKWGEQVLLLAVGSMRTPPESESMVYRSISGAMLVQTPDTLALNEDNWKVVTKRQPIESEVSDLRLAWLIAKHTKSNAISICKDGMLIGNGAGQMSRVMSCRIATWLAKENKHEDKLKGSAAASDAFFPFRDGPDILMDAGVTALIQPGGSKRDEDTIKACDERGVAMIFTGTRHFKH